jgi:hypothetical protein
MKKALLITLFLAFVLPAGSGEIARSWPDFYQRYSHYGQLGIVRSEGNGKLAISPLVPGQSLSAPQIGDRHFVFNHYLRQGGPPVTYVAVLLFLAYPDDPTMVKPSLVVNRNSGWWRKYCPGSRPSCYRQAGESHQYFDPALAEKVRADHLQDRVEVVDVDLNRKFDGYPIPESALDSWEERRFWTHSPKDDPMCNKPATKCVVEYQLLRFSPTRSPASLSHVDFHANTWSVKGASIYVFSPEEPFDAHYTVNFSQP